MSKFLKLGIFSITPLIATSFAFFWRPAESIIQITKPIINTNIDESIVLISKLDEQFQGACRNTIGRVGQEQQRTISNADLLFSYMWRKDKQVSSDMVKISFPNHISPESFKDLIPVPDLNNLPTKGFQEYTSNKPFNSVFKILWKSWISNWNSKNKGITKIIYTKSTLEAGPDNALKIDSLFKCHDGYWYGFEFVASRPQDLPKN